MSDLTVDELRALASRIRFDAERSPFRQEQEEGAEIAIALDQAASDRAALDRVRRIGPDPIQEVADRVFRDTDALIDTDPIELRELAYSAARLLVTVAAALRDEDGSAHE